MVEAPFEKFQSSDPVEGATPITPFPDWRATMVCPPNFMVTGEVQLAILGRAIFHLLAPLSRSKPAAKDSESFSIWATKVFPAMRGEEDIPRLLEALG